MKKRLSPLGLLWISFTSMIGSGWLFGALYSAHFAGPAALLAWPLAGFLLFFVALAYAEVATMFPEPNSLARLPFYTHGRLTSIIMSALTWLTLATIPMIETQGVIQYASNYLPSLMLQSGVHHSITPVGYIAALIILFSFVVLNYFGIRLFAYINGTFTIWKLIIPTLTIFCLLKLSYHPENFYNYGGFMPYGLHGVLTAISEGGVLFSLLGFRQVVIMGSEIENPQKFIPIILIASLIMTTLLYTALQYAFIGSLRGTDLTLGWANLTFPGDAGPFAALALIAGLGWLSILLYADAFISPYSTGLVYSTTAAHMLSSVSAIGDASSRLATENNYGAPVMSLVMNFILAAFMLLLFRDWQEMAAFLVATLMVTYSVGPLCLICLRKQLPEYPRPFRLHYAYVSAFFGFYICTAGVYWSGLHSILKLLLLTIIGLTIFILNHRLRKSNVMLDTKNSLWIFIYLIGISAFSYGGNFGGHHWIPKYWDLLYLLIFSLFIYWIALYSRKSSGFALSQLQTRYNV